MNYNNLPPLPQANARQATPYQSEWSLSTYLSQVMRKVYVKMTLGLLVTALVSLFLWMNPDVLMKMSGFLLPLVIVELGLVFVLSLAINKLKPAVATVLCLCCS